jgi:CheY-like chemotaxis protein
MRADSEVLVLEDDQEEMNLIKGAVQRVDLVALDAPNPRKALARLHYHRPVLAVIDLDMSRAERSAKTVNDVLARLYEHHGECITLVYSSSVSTIVQQDRVIGVHPMALFQDRNEGDEALVRRISRLLTARFGDLVIENGVVRHQTSGKTYRHRVAVSLVMARRSRQDVALDESASKAARRFKAWLREVGSAVEVVTRGRKHYGLEKRA